MTRRLVILIWEEGEPLTIDYEGTFDMWEARAVLEEALGQIETESQEEEA